MITSLIALLECFVTAPLGYIDLSHSIAFLLAIFVLDDFLFKVQPEGVSKPQRSPSGFTPE